MRVRLGEPRWAVAIRLSVHRTTVEKWTAHLPGGTKRDSARASIVERIERGDSLDCIASLEACTLAFVACIARAWAGELAVSGGVAARART